MLRTITHVRTKNKRKHEINEIRQFAYIFKTEGRDLINQITNINYKKDTIPPQYISIESMKKKNSKL